MKSTFVVRIFVIFFISGLSAFAQTDTLKVMVYNLTNYGNNIGGCTSATNGLTLKNPEFKTIVKHVNPDILGVNEMNTNPAIASSFLANVLNTDGVTHYKRSNQQVETSGSTITSMLFFNSDKLTLKNQSFVNTSTRLVHHFRLYLNTSGITTGDTIWVNAMVCHLKAGNTTPDATERGNQALAVRNYLNTFSKKENFMIMGDFNTYRSSETAFVNLTASTPNPTYQFLDPVNRVGSWTVNSSFADVHTQCPSITSNGCFSGGGLDDRFDFILMNRYLLGDSAKLKYIPETYKSLGNDGQHYNKNITDSPTNTSAPSNVILSLIKASDHLPVHCRLLVNGTFITSVRPNFQVIDLMGYFNDNMLVLSGLPDGRIADMKLWDLSGRPVLSIHGEVENGSIQFEAKDLSKGIYFGHGIMDNGKSIRLKLLKDQ